MKINDLIKLLQQVDGDKVLYLDISTGRDAISEEMRSATIEVVNKSSSRYDRKIGDVMISLHYSP